MVTAASRRVKQTCQLAGLLLLQGHSCPVSVSVWLLESVSVSVSVARLGSAPVSGFVGLLPSASVSVTRLGSASGSGSCPRLSQKQLPQGGNIFRNKCGFCGLKLFAAAVTPQYADGGKPRCGCAFDVMGGGRRSSRHGRGRRCPAWRVHGGLRRPWRRASRRRAAADKREVVREPEMPGNLLRETGGFRGRHDQCRPVRPQVA